MENSADYFKKYRLELGFSNQNNAKFFLAAKDIKPNIDYAYIELLNKRLIEILKNLNKILIDDLKNNDLNLFSEEHITHPYEILKNNNIISKLNNQGRRPEQVLFSWLRGFAIVELFKTICIHIDVFNGQVAFIRLDSIKNDDVNFVTRQQMEGQSVFSIDQNYFKWRLLDALPSLEDLEVGL
jgi:hypothetical protein